MTTHDVHAARARSTRSGPRRRRAAAGIALSASCLVVGLAVPAGATTLPWWKRLTTTTTVKPTTTTTVKPTTTSTAPSTTTSTVAASPVDGTCGGTSIVKADGTPWQCSFDDEFSGAALDPSKWVVQTTAASGFHSGPECFVNTPNNVAVANGTLSLTVRREAAPFTCTSPTGSYSSQYTSGMVMTNGKFSQAYGRFEVRAKLPAAKVKGLQESFWLWPQNPYKYGVAWPSSGEIDIAEVYSQYPDRAIPYVHYVPSVVDPNVTNDYCLIDDITQFHTYTAEWTPSTITIKYDGQTCLVDSWTPGLGLVKPAPFDQPFMVALTQALGIGGNAFNATTTPLPATTTVDYVRVWK